MQILKQTPKAVDTKIRRDQHSNYHIATHNLALQKFQRKCRGKLLATVGQYLPELEAQEVVQDAFLKVFLIAKQDPSLHSFYHKLERLGPLLFTAAKNLAISKTRHKQVRERYLQIQALAITQQSSESIEAKVAKEEDYELLNAAINQLPPICQKVFVARKIQGKSHDAIAQEFDISKKTVENHITKGLKLCREYMSSKVNRHSNLPATQQKRA